MLEGMRGWVSRFRMHVRSEARALALVCWGPENRVPRARLDWTLWGI